MTPAYTPRYMRLANNLVRARKRAGLSQMKLCAAVGISHRHMVRLEKGEHYPSPQLLSSLAEALGVPREQLEPDDDDEESHPVSLDELLAAHVRRLVSEAFARETAA